MYVPYRVFLALDSSAAVCAPSMLVKEAQFAVFESLMVTLADSGSWIASECTRLAALPTRSIVAYMCRAWHR